MTRASSRTGRLLGPSASLARVLTPPDSPGSVTAATVAQVNADGTVIVDFGAGRRSGPSRCMTSYTPLPGDVVEVQRRDSSSWLVLGAVRSSNTSTQTAVLSVRTPYNVRPSVAVANPFTVSAIATVSWRDNDGWSRTMPYQGAYSPGNTYWRGLAFYGAAAFAALAGRTCTSLTINLQRNSAEGSSAATGLWVAPHVHDTQPTTPPSWADDPVLVGSLTNTAPAYAFTLPTTWGQMLIDGRAKGFGLLRLTSADYLRCKSFAELPASFQLKIGWV